LNVFSFIKKIESYKKTLIIKYRDVKNEMRYILCKSQERTYNTNNSGVKTSPNSSSLDIQREKDRLLYLTNMKSKLIEEIVQYKNAYSHIDNAFIEEIQNAENKKIGLIMILFGVRPRVVNNPLIQKYLTN
jgi:DNA replicative helicase MCM subunit Mcm2 (Cdc46/Mcm family)